MRVLISAIGSSPRVRGKRAERVLGPDPNRLIPARAGKTPAGLGPSAPRPAHPRACGENPGRGDHTGILVGSSPRVRGKQHFSLLQTHICRLIPARAGKTAGHRRPTSYYRAHPRACGEN
ncbi:hypothetical protein HMPREF9005_1190 [Actinomyces sp. oral taxon 178 str. F0338]|nr:hypothetical protein HMPREF9005_1190 [Actinomyces sp. oral taxon 178 str. F0338]